MFEVSIAPEESQGLPVAQIAEQLWRISQDAIAQGTLDALGERTFTDGKMRKVLGKLMQDPPRSFMKLVRATLDDDTISTQRIRDSLSRLWGGAFAPCPAPNEGGAVSRNTALPVVADARSAAAKKAWDTRREDASEHYYGESHHLSGKPQEVIELYRAVDRFCLSLEPGKVQKSYGAVSIRYFVDRKSLCWLRLQQYRLRVWLPLEFDWLDSPPGFARDVSHVGHSGGGDLELTVRSASQVEEVLRLIRKSYDERAR